MQILENAKVVGNRVEVGDWYIQPLIVGSSQCDDVLQFQVTNKIDCRKWYFDSFEEALEAVK